MVRAALCAAHGWPDDAVIIVPVSTSGDRIQDRALAEVGGKALWTKELDRALCERSIDLAVHSMKDVETVRPVEIAIAAVLPRADVRDRLIGAPSFDALRKGAVVGTSAPRRAAQLLRMRPDFRIVLFRGNVGTRLAKLEVGEADATLLAAAGLERLGRDDVGSPIPVDMMLPAPAQGAVGVEVRAEDAAVRDAVSAINHHPTRQAVRTERALLYALGADCRSPVAALATMEGGGIRLRAEILTNDGSLHLAREATLAAPEDAASLAADMLAEAPAPLRSLFAA